MPWHRSQAYRRTPYFVVIASAILAVCLGGLIGYTRWGTTASIVELVERQLSKTRERIRVLENRLGSVESRLRGGKLEPSEILDSPIDSAPPQAAASNSKRTTDKPKQ